MILTTVTWCKFFRQEIAGLISSKACWLSAGKSESAPRPLDLNHQVKHVAKLLDRTIPKMVAVELSLAEALDSIHGDPTQVEQVLINLAVNANDAMTEGGRLTIGTENVSLDSEYCSSYPEARPGKHVLLSVSDTGHGMDRETLEHAFEPFFTTKAKGKGTGLGLAMVYGIVKQHKGHITCFSKPGTGTTFRIYFPIVETEPQKKVLGDHYSPPRGTETILLVDDEDSIRELGEKLLKRSGYKVLAATNGREALETYDRERDNVSLIILDFVMPEMGGKECLGRLVQINPDVKVVIASGYASGGTANLAEELGAKAFVKKPFDMRILLQTVRDVLDAE